MAVACPANPPPPDGYHVWRGPVPSALVQWAIDLRDHFKSFPYGTTWQMAYAGEIVIARKDTHTWTWRGGQLVTGICIPGVTLYRAAAQATQAAGGVTSQLAKVDDLSTPDPTLAVYGADQATDWKLVAVGALASLATIGAFVAAIHIAAPKRRPIAR